MKLLTSMLVCFGLLGLAGGPADSAVPLKPVTDLTVAKAPAPASMRARPGSALWVWSWGRPGRLANDVVALGFDRVYLYCQGGFTTRVKRTIRQLAKRGMVVEALGGEPNWATTAREGMLDFIAAARRYQQNAGAGARLGGIHLDVEPHALKAWDRRPRQVRLGFLRSLRAATRASGKLPLAADLPFWFDGIKLRYRGQRLPLSVAALKEVDAATLMAYRDRAADVIEVSRQELKQAARLGKPLTIGVETGETTPEQVTFFEEGKRALDLVLTRIRKSLDRNPAFAGTAVHSYRSLIELSG